LNKQQDIILISAPNKLGESFIRYLMARNLPVAVIANNKEEKRRLEKIGIIEVIVVDTTDQSTWQKPSQPIGKVFLFESSVNLTCRYLQICRSWTRDRIVVITQSHQPRHVYKQVGADQVKHVVGKDFSILMHSIHP
jgi:hypothetical protein